MTTRPNTLERHLRSTLAVVAGLSFATGAISLGAVDPHDRPADPARVEVPAVETLDPAEVTAKVRTYYREQVVNERVRVTLRRREPGDSPQRSKILRTAVFTYASDPVVAGGGGIGDGLGKGGVIEVPGGSVYLRLGRLWIQVRGGTLLAAAHRVSGSVYRLPLLGSSADQELLPSLLSAVLAPQLSFRLSLAAAQADDVLPPLVRNVQFTSATIDRRVQPPVFRLAGIAADYAVQVEADHRTGRLREVSAVSTLPGGGIDVQIEVAPLAAQSAPQLAERFEIDAREDRPRVADMRDLVAGATAIDAGVAGVPTVDIDWSAVIDEQGRSFDPSKEAEARGLVLVFLRPGGGEGVAAHAAASELSLASIRALEALAKLGEMHTGDRAPEVRAVVVGPLDQAEALDAAITKVARSSPWISGRSLVSFSPEATLGRLPSPHAVAEDGDFAGIVVLDSRGEPVGTCLVRAADEANTIAQQVSSMLP